MSGLNGNWLLYIDFFGRFFENEVECEEMEMVDVKE